MLLVLLVLNKSCVKIEASETVTNISTVLFPLCQFGIVGLVEEEWIATLSTIDPDDITFIDYVSEGRQLARELKAKVSTINTTIKKPSYLLSFLYGIEQLVLL